jgi:hypothetical protein
LNAFFYNWVLIIIKILGKFKLTEEERKFVSDYTNRIIPIITFSTIILGIYFHLVFNKTINFAKYCNISAEDLTEFSSRIKFVLLHLTLGIIWILISIHLVALKRLGTPALDPMYGYERITEAAKNNLTNSLEHFTISAISQLILVTDLEPETILNIIPALNVLLLIGRIAFWLGYPRYRGFGFTFFHFPIMATIGYNLYQLSKLYY